ncbi:hypothetical protein EZS27_012591 [termite gut metagenome]|jgi:hypothetical protein|uniref:Uncharacterized protein n=1 Tax=termite gut metagenome TaxID=433724 RepID=A0A5J4S002_9ZZZZ
MIPILTNKNMLSLYVMLRFTPINNHSYRLYHSFCNKYCISKINKYWANI